jgi:hypothetical protein
LNETGSVASWYLDHINLLSLSLKVGFDPLKASDALLLTLYESLICLWLVVLLEYMKFSFLLALNKPHLLRLSFRVLKKVKLPLELRIFAFHELGELVIHYMN